MTARYAIYYAPAAESALWQAASAWLGRDAATGAFCPQPAVDQVDAVTFAELTADPRHYGFHATLKAPFVMAEGRSEEELLAAAKAFALRRKAFVAPIKPGLLGKFAAFRLAEQSPEMQSLHEDCVEAFEEFRRPLDDADLERRRRAGLTPEQDARLLEWGYPHVFEGFRFHMTLTGNISDSVMQTRMFAAICDWFGADQQDHRFDAIAVFRQPDRASAFSIVARFPFG